MARITRRLTLIATRLRQRLAQSDARLTLSVFGLLTGVLAGLVIVTFRLLVDSTQLHIHGGATPDRFEQLSEPWRFALPVIGGLALALVFRGFAKGLHTVGVAHVIERLALHQGQLPVRGFVLQWVGAAIALISGHSVGREGPNAHLGAATGSLLSQGFGLPNNSTRVLVGCGVAAGIAASFNTPLAGMVFAIEVLLLEYRVATLLPIIIAAASANMIAKGGLGVELAFLPHGPLQHELVTLPLLAALGLTAGTLAAGFCHATHRLGQYAGRYPITWRLSLAGVLTGAIAVIAPQVMGLGYDTMQWALSGEAAFTMLIWLAVIKLLATSIAIGLNVPGGMIGPSLFMGAMAGAAVGQGAMQWLALDAFPASLVLIGMAATMAATLQAPLTALIALLELSHDVNILLPGMIAIVIANLTAGELFSKTSLWHAMLAARGHQLKLDPLTQALRTVGVADVMDTTVIRLPRIAHAADAIAQLTAHDAVWAVITDEAQRTVSVMATADIRQALTPAATTNQPIDLTTLPTTHLTPVTVDARSTLAATLSALDDAAADAAVITRRSPQTEHHTLGVITRRQITAMNPKYWAT